MSRTLRVAELASLVGGRVIGDADRAISGVSTLEAAAPHDLTYVESARYVRQLQATRAGAVLVPDGVDPPARLSAIRVTHPALAMVVVIDALLPATRAITSVSPLAVVPADARLGPDVGIGPYAVLGDEVEVGARTEIHPGVTIGPRTRIGEDCVLHAGVHVYADTIIGDRVILHSGSVIGADGFGYVREPLPTEAGEPFRHRKVRQVGRVVLEDDVEIGANSAVDRAALSETRIGRGTKIDNLVTIGHNSRVGRHCIVVGQTGLSGSSTLGNYVTLAGQVGVTGHLTIGDGAVVGAQSGVTKSIAPGHVVLGSPAVEGGRAKRALALLEWLPQFKKRLAAHDARLRALEAKHAPVADRDHDAIHSD